MALESATYVNQLDPALPTGTGSNGLKAEGDNVLRLVKSVLVATFPNLNGAVTVTPTQLNSVTGKAEKTGDTFTGTHDFTGATLNIATQTAGDSSIKAASTAFVGTAIAALAANSFDLTLNIATDASVTAVAGGMYVLTNAGATTVATPASPTAGQRFGLMVGNDRTDNVLAYAADKIGGLAESCTLNKLGPLGVIFRYINADIGWAISA